jgi:hypothetical protein
MTGQLVNYRPRRGMLLTWDLAGAEDAGGRGLECFESGGGVCACRFRVTEREGTEVGERGRWGGEGTVAAAGELPALGNRRHAAEGGGWRRAVVGGGGKRPC